MVSQRISFRFIFGLLIICLLFFKEGENGFIDPYEAIEGSGDSPEDDNNNKMAQKFDKKNDSGVDEKDNLFKTFGICHVEDAVSRMSDLEGCKEITSDLLIENTEGEWKEKGLITVEGCITIRNTQLRDVNFLLNLKRVACTSPTGNGVYSNSMMCIDNRTRETLGPFIQRLETTHAYCPVCTDDDKVDETSDCKTFVGDLNVFYHTENSTKKFDIRNLKEVVGSVKISVSNGDLKNSNGSWDYSLINKTDRLIINCPACEVPGLLIIGEQAPPLEFFDFLDMNLGNTRIAIQFQKYGSFRMLRGMHAALTDRFKREIDVDHEEDGDCHFDKLGEPYEYEDLMGCERITGNFVFNSAGVTNLHRSKWKTLELKGEDLTFQGDSELVKLLSHNVSVDFTKDTFRFYLDFGEQVCMNAQMLQLARKWMHKGINKEDQNRVYPANYSLNCNTYIGNITAYDLREDDGTHFEYVRGTVHLDALVVDTVQQRVRSAMGTPKTEQYKHIHISRFENLNSIKKPWNYPKDLPVLRIDMCSNLVQVPVWLTNVTLHSDREDDILLKVTGPAFKMDPDIYELLKNKYGAHRLDIHPLLPGECRFENNITDLGELDGCETVVGDLVLEGPITGETEAIIKHVTGCIRIVDTTLTNLDFLRFEIPYDISFCEECRGKSWFSIMNNTELCTTHNVFSLYKNKRHLVNYNKPDCGNMLPDNAIIEENVIIAGYANESQLAHLSDVVEIYGRIIVMSNSFDKFTIFKNLKLIKHLGPGPALLIESNKDLTTFSLPAIEEIVALDKDVVVLRDNPKLEIETHKAHLEKVMKQGNVLVEESDEVDNYLIYGFLVGFFVLLFIACLAIGGTILALWLMERKKKRNTAKKNDKTKKDSKDLKEEKRTLTDSSVETKNDSIPTDANNNVLTSAPAEEAPAVKSTMNENIPIA